MLGIANRPLYKWFWKRNKQAKIKAQPEDGSRRVTDTHDERAVEGYEAPSSIVVQTAKDQKRVFYKDLYQNWENDFIEISNQLGFDVETEAVQLVGTPSPQRSRIVFNLQTQPMAKPRAYKSSKPNDKEAGCSVCSRGDSDQAEMTFGEVQE